MTSISNLRILTKYRLLKSRTFLSGELGLTGAKSFSSNSVLLCDKKKSDMDENSVYPGHIATTFMQKMALAVGSGMYDIV